MTPKRKVLYWDGWYGRQYKAIFNPFWNSVQFYILGSAATWESWEPTVDELSIALKSMMAGVQAEVEE
jgi:hypothetical protein